MRVILLNPIYVGTVRWNTSRWRLNAKSGTMMRTERAQSDWERYTSHEEAYRIVPDALWQAVHARIKTLSNEDKRLKSGGKAVYRLSGLLKGGVCERNFVVASGTHYARQSSKHGPCTNTIRQRRDEVEHHILGEIDRRLLDPKMVALMARQIETELNRRSAAVLRMAVDKPAELIALEAHIARLRAPLKAGAAGIGLGSCIRFTASSCAAPAPGSDTEPKECRVRPG